MSKDKLELALKAVNNRIDSHMTTFSERRSAHRVDSNVEIFSSLLATKDYLENELNPVEHKCCCAEKKTAKAVKK